MPLLKGKSIVNLFFENSTRTRTTLKSPRKACPQTWSAPDISTSATAKGESLLDTLKNLRPWALIYSCPAQSIRRTALYCRTLHTKPSHRQRRRWAARSPHPSHAGHVHHPPAKGRYRQSKGGHHRRHRHSRVVRRSPLWLDWAVKTFD